MHISALLLTSMLSSMVAAVDISAFTSSGCGAGNYATCSNIGANVCCIVAGQTTGASSGQFRQLSGNTRIRGFQRTRDGNNCGATFSDHTTTAGSACISIDIASGQYSGLAWSAAGSSKRRGVSLSSDECTSSQQVDEMGLADGTKFCIKDASAETAGEMWAWIVEQEITKSAVVPDKFAAYKC